MERDMGFLIKGKKKKYIYSSEWGGPEISFSFPWKFPIKFSFKHIVKADNIIQKLDLAFELC